MEGSGRGGAGGAVRSVDRNDAELELVEARRSIGVGAYVAGHSLFSLPEIAVQSFGLYSSKLTPYGAVHTLEGEYPLEGVLEGPEESG